MTRIFTMTTSAETAASLLRPHEEKTERRFGSFERTKLSKYTANPTQQIVQSSILDVNQMNIFALDVFLHFGNPLDTWIFLEGTNFFVQFNTLSSGRGQRRCDKSIPASGIQITFSWRKFCPFRMFSVLQWSSVGNPRYLGPKELGGRNSSEFGDMNRYDIYIYIMIYLGFRASPISYTNSMGTKT